VLAALIAVGFVALVVVAAVKGWDLSAAPEKVRTGFRVPLDVVRALLLIPLEFTRTLLRIPLEVMLEGLTGGGLLTVVGLAVTWVPWGAPWIPPLINDIVVNVRTLWAVNEPQIVRQLLPQLTAGWDLERLRLAATVWVVVEGFGLLAIRQLPIPLIGAPAAVALLGLVSLQYAAVGGGQPVWAMEHVVLHIMDVAAIPSGDVEAFRQFVHQHFQARGYHPITLRSQASLTALAFELAVGINYLLQE
jgi:hypothetical protein